MTDAGVLEAVETITHLDFDPEQICEFNGAETKGRVLESPGCDQPAEWSRLATCCGAIELFCDRHRALVASLDCRPGFWRHRLGMHVGKAVIWTRLGGRP